VVSQLNVNIVTGRNVIDVSNQNIPVSKGNVIGYYTSVGLLGKFTDWPTLRSYTLRFILRVI